MTVLSMHCEARKIAYRQSKDGLVVSFVIHPNDMPDALAVAPLGQRYMLALAAIGDDEKPVETRKEVMPHKQPRQPEQHNATPPETGAVAFTASERGKQRYAAANDMEKARLRSVLLAKDIRFRDWLGVNDEANAAHLIRTGCCAGESRRLIAEDDACYRAFLAMETDYLLSIGALPEIR